MRKSVIGELARVDFYAAIKRSLTKHIKVWQKGFLEVCEDD